MTDQPWWLKPDPSIPVVNGEDPSAVKMKRVDTPFVIVCDRGHFRQIEPPDGAEELQTWIKKHSKCQAVLFRRPWRFGLVTAVYLAFLFAAWWLINDRMGNPSRGGTFVDQLEGVGLWIAVFAIYNLGHTLIRTVRKKLKR